MTSATDHHGQNTTDGLVEPARRHVTFVGVIGELLITLGVVLALFIVWQNWWTDAVNSKVVKQEQSVVLNDWGATMGPDGIIGPVAPEPSHRTTHLTPLGSATGAAQPQRWASPVPEWAVSPWPHVASRALWEPNPRKAGADESVSRRGGHGGVRAAAVGFRFAPAGEVSAGHQTDRAIVPSGRTPLPAPQKTHGSAKSSGKKTKGKTSKKDSLKKPKRVQTIGFMYAPALRKKRLWATPIVQGTSDRALARGVGHYQGSAAFGGIGNAAVAGHRTTHGAPFRYIDKLKRGDHIVVRIRNWWFVYVLDRSTIVRPKEHWVLKARPYKTNSGRLITLTSCHPLHSASRRFVWWGHLVRKMPATGAPPAELKMRR